MCAFWLTHKEADLYSGDHNGDLPIYSVVVRSEHHKPTIEFIFKTMAEKMDKKKLLDYRNHNSQSLLDHAVSRGSAHSIGLVIHVFPELILTNPSHGNSLVQLAVNRFHNSECSATISHICFETFQLIKQKDPTRLKEMVLQTDAKGRTPIVSMFQHIVKFKNVCFTHELGVVQFLMKEGASISAVIPLLKNDAVTQETLLTLLQFATEIVDEKSKKRIRFVEKDQKEKEPKGERKVKKLKS